MRAPLSSNRSWQLWLSHSPGRPVGLFGQSRCAALPFATSRWWYSSSEMHPQTRGRPGCPVFVSFLIWSHFFKLSLPFFLPSTNCISHTVFLFYSTLYFFALHLVVSISAALRVIESRVTEQEGHSTNSSPFWRSRNCWSATCNKSPELSNASRCEMIMSPECHNLSAGGVAVPSQCHIVLMPNQLTAGKHISLLIVNVLYVC